MSEDGNDHDDEGIKKLAHRYLRAVENAEAKKEEILAEWAEEYYRPGYLDDDEWRLLKDLVESSDHEHALMQLEIAAYRKAATELGREDEFDDDWPAKDRDRDTES
jgi:ABC-type nitrate/sulfonate/bicarbonate transport system substrate-binding protein